MRHEFALVVENEYATAALVFIRKTDLDKQVQAEDIARSLQSCLEALPVADSFLWTQHFQTIFVSASSVLYTEPRKMSKRGRGRREHSQRKSGSVPDRKAW